MKELADNALDAGCNVKIGNLPDGGYYIQDDGPGIPPDQIARLFSIDRPLVSSKLLRSPSRGVLGNGLRVVAGAVLASDGLLKVITCDQEIIVTPQEDGDTTVTAQPIDFPTGTRIEIHLGEDIPSDPQALVWARLATRVADSGEIYQGRSSPHWYDSGAFFELMQAAGDRFVREMIAELDGCSGAKAGKIAADFSGRSCKSLSRADCKNLLLRARESARPVNPKRLGGIGETSALEPHYAKMNGSFQIGAKGTQADIPFVVEAWADSDDVDNTGIDWMVNRTPITGGILHQQNKADLLLKGCGIPFTKLKIGRRQFFLTINIVTPHCPITTDGKEPDLSYFKDQIFDVIGKAVRKAHRATPAGRMAQTQISIIYERVKEGVAKAGDGGKYRFNQRQLFYVIRPYLIDHLGREPSYKTFSEAITDYETEFGDVPGMYRDIRGSLYHPHIGQDIPLGTLNVERYRRPDWMFNKVVYIEKEGFFEIPKEEQWPERHDCAIMTGKGYATRAVKDLLDLLGETDEPITVFCVHDADAAGTMIYQTLQEETRARPGRNIEIINFGLEPWEAVEMGLSSEDISSKKARPVANYVRRYRDDVDWEDWLQDHRIELNAMTTPQFLGWLDGKMAKYDGKVMPPDPILETRMAAQVKEQFTRKISERILREAGLDEQVQVAVDAIDKPDADAIRAHIGQVQSEDPVKPWTDPLDALAHAITSKDGIDPNEAG